jgi:uncharacterized phage protein (TIGR02216 family)
MSGFDWPDLMRAGMQGLHLSPQTFWQLTPAELRLMLGQAAADRSSDRAGLDTLLAAYPDAGIGEDDDG